MGQKVPVTQDDELVSAIWSTTLGLELTMLYYIPRFVKRVRLMFSFLTTISKKCIRNEGFHGFVSCDYRTTFSPTRVS